MSRERVPSQIFRCRPRLVRDCARERGPITTGRSRCATAALPVIATLLPVVMGPGSRSQVLACPGRQWRRREATFPRRECARVLRHPRPSGNRGRRECRALAAPAASFAKTTKQTSIVTTGQPKRSGIPCTMVYGLLRDLPGEPAFLPPSPVDRSVSAAWPKSHLDALVPGIGGTGPHGLTVRFDAHRLRTSASIASRPTCRDDWPKRPPCWGGISSLNHKLRLSERQLFLSDALDTSGKTGSGFLVFCPSCR